MELTKAERTQKFLQKIVEKLTPHVVEAVETESSGHFEVHFDKGEYRRAKKRVDL